MPTFRVSYNIFVAIAAVALVDLCTTSVLALSPLKHSRARENSILIRGKYFRRGFSNSFNSSSNKPQAGSQPALFEQCKDHNDLVNGTCVETWNQRYWLRWDFYKPGGPVFFMINEESNADGVIDGGTWLHYAKHYNAACVVLEHRFYGESFPVQNPTEEDFKLLTSQQALSDADNFISFYIMTDGSMDVEDEPKRDLYNAKVVVFGGSYGGNLVAWFREKHTSANIAVSSSGPLEARFDFSEYMGVVADVLRKEEPKCYNRIHNAFDCMHKIVNGENCNTSKKKASDLPKAMHQCYEYDFEDQYEKELFFTNLGSKWASNYPGTENKEKCQRLSGISATRDPIDLYGKYVKASGEGEDGCRRRRINFPEDNEVLKFIRSAEDEAKDGKSWTWQTCNEFGYYQTADGTLFARDEWTTILDVRTCQEAFPNSGFTAEKIQENVDKTNEYYKGKENDGTCIIFVNGEWDPWHVLGINKASETSKHNFVIQIPKGEHCEDMSGYEGARRETKAAIDKINKQIGVYLKDGNCKRIN